MSNPNISLSFTTLDNRYTLKGKSSSYTLSDPLEYSYLRGINVAGGEFSQTASTLPGTQGTDYAYNSYALMKYLRKRGHKIVRLPFAWERVQHILSGSLDAMGIAELDTAIQACADAGLSILLDCHNGGYYYRLDDVQVSFNNGITEADFSSLWSQLVTRYSDQPAIVGWGLMNEPNGLTAYQNGTSAWKGFSQAAVNAIRTAGDTRDIYVAGDHSSNVSGWVTYNGAPWITDSYTTRDAIVYEGHYYFDANKSGVYASNYASIETDAVNKGFANLTARVTSEVGEFTSWLSQYGKRGFIGEIGWPFDATDSASYNAIGDVIYKLLDAAKIGATFWATGTRWSSSYKLQAYAYDGTATNFTPNAQAPVIESHLSRQLAQALTVGGASPMAYVGNFSVPITDPSTVRPATLGPVYWVCLDGITPVNAQYHDIIVTRPTYSATVLLDGPLTYLALSNDTLDTGQYGLNGTLVGSGTFDGTKLSLNGSGQYITLPNSSTLRPTTGLTIEAFINATSVSSLQYIWHGRNSPYQDFIFGGSGRLRAELMLTASGSATQLYSSTNSISAGAEHHVVMTYDGSIITLWCDGVQLASTTQAGTLNWGSDTNLQRIGSDLSGSNQLSGTIRRFAMYGYALSASAIKTHYAARNY